MALAFDDDIFVAIIKNMADIYTAFISAHRRDIQINIKRDKLDILIFREPECTAEGY